MSRSRLSLAVTLSVLWVLGSLLVPARGSKVSCDGGGNARCSALAFFPALEVPVDGPLSMEPLEDTSAGTGSKAALPGSFCVPAFSVSPLEWTERERISCHLQEQASLFIRGP